MKLYCNDKVVGENMTIIPVTAAEYAQLTEEEKKDPTIIYHIKDQETTEEEALLGDILAAIGDNSQLAEYGDGTLVGALIALHQRLGGISFQVDAQNHLVAAKVPDPTPVEPIEIDDTMSDREKIEAISEAIGSISDLATDTGYGTLSEAILAIFDKLNGLSFSFDETAGEVSVTYGEEETP